MAPGIPRARHQESRGAVAWLRSSQRWVIRRKKTTTTTTTTTTTSATPPQCPCCLSRKAPPRSRRRTKPWRGVLSAVPRPDLSRLRSEGAGLGKAVDRFRPAAGAKTFFFFFRSGASYAVELGPVQGHPCPIVLNCTHLIIVYKLFLKIHIRSLLVQKLCHCNSRQEYFASLPKYHTQKNKIVSKKKKKKRFKKKKK